MKKLGQKYERCLRCHRKLKTVDAQKRGYGQHCFQLHLAELKRKSKTLLEIAEEQNKNTQQK